MGETRDLRDTYPFSLEETILTEIIAIHWIPAPIASTSQPMRDRRGNP
jgi:hypothetical protein